MSKVFLGGTCNNSTWREDLIPLLTIDYFNPVVADWTPECMAEEIKQREVCDFCLYVITPEMTGVYSIAEAIDDSNKRPEKTVFCYLDGKVGGSCTFTSAQIKSLGQVAKMVETNGGLTTTTLNGVASLLSDQPIYHNIAKNPKPTRGVVKAVESPGTKIVTLCGSSRFVDIMAVCAWQIEKEENAIAMGLHLLPVWYPNCPPDHLAEHEGVEDQMDALHLLKIDQSDEIFVVDFNDYIGSSTSNEIAHAKNTGKPVRYFTSDPVGLRVSEMIKSFLEKNND